MIVIRKALDTRKDKKLSTDSLIELVENLLKNNIFEHNISVFKQLRETTIGTKMVPRYAIMFMDSLEEDILRNSLLKRLFWWRYIDGIFMIWKHAEEGFKRF